MNWAVIDMLNEALLFLLDILLQPFAAILLLRFHLQWLRAPLRNPVGEFIMVLTDFMVLRTRRFVPSVMGLDSATLLLALLVEILYLSGFMWAQGFPWHGFPLPGLLALAAVKLLKTSLYLLMAAVFAQAILSWVNPYSPIAPLLTAATRRFLQPLRRIVPVLGSVDLSPLLLFIICQLIVIVPIRALEQVATRLL
ncbi:MAG: YggT family protein [Gallionella sp.]|nr:YggT family protein [Gallionella sp.]